MNFNEDYAINVISMDRYDEFYSYCLPYADAGDVNAMRALACFYKKHSDPEKSFQYAEMAHKAGHIPCTIMLSDFYLNGYGTRQDKQKGIDLLHKAIALGSSDGIAHLAHCYEIGDGVPCDYDKAIELYIQAIDQGSELSISMLKSHYSEEKGLKWCVEAAKYESIPAKFDLARYYEKGEGIKKDMDKALELYNYCADENYPPALSKLGMYYAYKHQTVTAYNFYKKAVELGHESSKSHMNTIKASIEKSESIHLNAERGNAKAQCDYAERFEEGRGVNQDFKKAFSWYMRAAENGNLKAQYKVGVFIELGLYDGNPSPEAAISWYMKATNADQPYSVALYKLYELYRDGNVVPKNINRAKSYLIRAAKRSYTSAALELAQYYEQGSNYFERDIREAARFYNKAAECNNPEAKNHIEEVLKLAENGDAEAQYFAWAYYINNTRDSHSQTAIKMLQNSASQGYEPAIKALYNNNDTQKDDQTPCESNFVMQNTSINPDLTAEEIELIDAYTSQIDDTDIESIYELGMVYKSIAERTDNTDMWNNAAANFKQAAEAGLAQAQFEYALCCGRGKGTKQDSYKAFEWHKKAAERGEVRALTSMGICYLRGRGVLPDKDLAASCFEQASSLGDIEAKYRLGQYHSHTSPKLSFSLYLDAAKQGHIKSQHSLGYCYENGLGIEKDIKKALYWYMLASDSGSSAATYSLAVCYERGNGVEVNPEKALTYYMHSAEMGNAAAQYKIARMYATGKILTKDLNKAFYWFYSSSESGNHKAINALGSCFESGSGTNRNITKAFDYYKKAAMLGNPSSQYRLAIYYSSGIHTQRNFEKALNYCKLAVENGNSHAICKLGRWHEKGFIVEQDYHRAVYLYTEAANKGNPVAQFYLAVLNAEGKGVTKNISQAIELYYMSAAKNFPPALYRLGVCHEIGYGVEQNISKAIMYYRQASVLGYEPAILSYKKLFS